MDIPDALKYGASHSTIRTNRFRIVPQGSDSAQPNGVFRVRLPEKSLVRLSSLSAYFNGNITGLDATGAGNYVNALMPASYKFFRAVRFYVGGAIASGGLCNNYDQLYHQLLISSADRAWVESRYNEGYRELIANSDDVIYTSPTTPLQAPPTALGVFPIPSKTQYLTCSDFLGLPRCNGGGGVIDTSLYSSVEVEFILNDLSILSTASATANVSGVSWNISNFRVDVDCVVSVSPMYVEMMALRLQDAAPIRFAYQNFVTSISQNTNSNRIQVNSQSVDMLAVSPLRNAWATAPSLTGMTNNMMQPPRYKFDTKIGSSSGSTADQQTYVTAEGNITLQLQVGSDTYPKTQITHALMIPDLTINTLYHGSLYSKNLFSNGLLAGAATFQRSYGLSDNFVWINNFSLESEGWATKKLTGIDTSAQNVDIILNSSGFGAVAEPAAPNGNGATGNFWLITALTTSQLVYDPSTASVSIIA